MRYVTPIKEREVSSRRRAAQYVRMSSDPQKYSIEIQAAAIAAYAARRGIEITHTYSDPGRSGLSIAGRDGLQQLIHDVQNGRANFDCILVYDISRWGRFQDIDESAYYEFVCKRAGFPVHYCAEEFENDGSLTSVVLKNLTRVRAAGFSRELSKKVFSRSMQRRKPWLLAWWTSGLRLAAHARWREWKTQRDITSWSMQEFEGRARYTRSRSEIGNQSCPAHFQIVRR
jgi:predicted site-specific integrase-resolvase